MDEDEINIVVGAKKEIKEVQNSDKLEKEKCINEFSQNILAPKEDIWGISENLICFS